MKTPFFTNVFFLVLIPSPSTDLVPIPSGMCGLSIKLNSSFDIFFLKLLEKQLFFSFNVLKLKFAAITNDNSSPTE